MAPSIPKTCKAVVIEKAGAPLTIKEVEVKRPNRGEVLVKVHACGVCFSDVGVQRGEFGPMVNYPVIPGHELVGTIVAVGEGETRWQVGERVGGAWHGGSDGTCRACNRGLFQMCDNAAVNGVTKDGGYSEYCVLRTEAVVKVPEDADPSDIAPLLCAGVTVFNSIRNMGVIAGDIIAIQGLGGLGHLGIQYARKLGNRTVAISSSGAKRDFAFKLGATDYIDSSKEDTAQALQKMGGAALILVTAPNPKIMGPLVDACAPRGKVVVLAPVGEIPVNTVSLISKGISVHGWPAGHALDTEEAIAFAKTQDVNVMVEKFPMDQVQKAFDKLIKGDMRFRGVLTME